MRRILGSGLALGALVLALVLWWPEREGAKVALRPAPERSPIPAPTLPDPVRAAPTASEPERAPADAAAEPAPPAPAPESPPASSSPAIERAARVTLFQHAHLSDVFPGDAWVLGSGLTDAGFAFRDDDASAVEIPAGASATLYDGPGGTGRRITLGPGLHNLDPYGLNDRVSSVRVMPRAKAPSAPAGEVVLYRDVVLDGTAQAGDWRLRLPEGSVSALYSSANGDFDARALSAVLVPEGLELSLFVQPDGRGHALVVGPGYHELEPAGYNDRVCSVRIAREAER